jgi:hypothetical protein
MPHSALPPPPAGMEWAVFVMQSDLTALSASTRVELDANRYRNPVDDDFYVTDVGVQESAGGNLIDVGIEIRDTTRNRSLMNLAISVPGITDLKTAPVANSSLIWELKEAYRLPGRGGFNVVGENFNSGTARTVRVTIIGYHMVEKKEGR